LPISGNSGGKKIEKELVVQRRRGGKSRRGKKLTLSEGGTESTVFF